MGEGYLLSFTHISSIMATSYDAYILAFVRPESSPGRYISVNVLQILVIDK